MEQELNASRADQALGQIVTPDLARLNGACLDFVTDKLAQLLSLTREPVPALHKVYAGVQLHPELQVSMRDVHLSNGEIATLYVTSGPCTDPSDLIRLHAASG